MHTTPHQNASLRRGGYQNAMLTAIAALLALGVIDRHAGSGDAALAQPSGNGPGLTNQLDQNKQMITELRTLNGKMDAIVAKLNSGLSVKVTEMPALKLPADVKAKAEKGDKPEPQVEVKPGK